MAKVLVVDDEEDLRLAVRFALQIAGHEVMLAGSGREALEAIDEHRPDALLLDIRLPDVDGWEVLEQLRSSGRLDRLGVLLFSAHSDPEARARALAAGCKGVIPKPFALAELTAAVDAITAG